MKQVQSITIAIPAHNEEGSIGKCLRTVLGQKIGSYNLESIIVVADGCTDNTAAIAKEHSRQDTRIHVINDGVHRGKLGALNLVFAHAQTDFVICLDADVQLADTHVISSLLKPFDDKSVSLVGGELIPAHPETFWQRVGVAWNGVWMSIRHAVPNSVHNISGCIYAVRRNLYANFSFPPEIVADDEFMYFANRKSGHRFTFAPDAAVTYKLPATFKDYVLQSARFIDTKHQLIRHFGQEVYAEYEVPKALRYKTLLRALVRDPFYLTIACLVQLYITDVASRVSYTIKDGVWAQAKSTK